MSGEILSSKNTKLFSILKKLDDVKGLELPGLETAQKKEVLARQIVDSIRRIEYVEKLEKVNLSELRKNPNSTLFDPLKAAVLHSKNGNVDEAFWLLFLATHFGKSPAYGWSVVSDIYGRRGEGEAWTWDRVTADWSSFESWFKLASLEICNEKPKLKFSNHRKYQSLRHDTKNSVPTVVKSYIDYIGSHNSHLAKIAEAEYATSGDKSLQFDYFFKGLKSQVKSFSRLGVFDLVTMWAKVGLVNFYPQKAYFAGSTGPIPGATLLFYGVEGGYSPDALEEKLSELSPQLDLGSYSMQIFEDALCNWQKSPTEYIQFKG